MQKHCQLCGAILQAATVRDFAWKFTGELKMGGREIKPASHRLTRRWCVEGGIDFNRRKVARVKVQPMRFRKIRRVERLPPLGELLGSRAERKQTMQVECVVPTEQCD